MSMTHPRPSLGVGADESEDLPENPLDGREIGPEMTEFTEKWLIGQIMESDDHLGGFLKGRSAG